ncbi:MAG: glycosyltransferase family 1 protein [Desulfurellales bacterium]|nr:MAG: glycosyltransferase family 1 protein [Desulfurellales bacterium]
MRAEMMSAVLETARGKNWRVGIYGENWEAIDPTARRTTYDFAVNRALYKGCKIALGNNQFGDTRGFVSDRIFQVLAAGTFFLQQKISGLKELTGITPGVHFIEWDDLDDLRYKLIYWMDPAQDDMRQRIAERGRRFVETYHTYDARVRQLFDELLPLARRRHASAIRLRYIGASNQHFGYVGAVTGRQYEHAPGELLIADERDVPFMLEDGIWEKA